MKKHTYLLLLFIMNGVFGSAQECGALITPLSIQERVNEATHIIEGKVIASDGYWDVNKHNIYTVHTVTTYKSFKGKGNTTFKVVTIGGQVDNHFQLTSSSAYLQPGMVGTFFMKSFKGQIAVSESLYELVGAVQGVVKYNKLTGKVSDVFNKYTSKENDLYTQIQQATGYNAQIIQEFPVYNKNTAARLANPIVYSFSPLTASAGTQTVFTITGNNFGTETGTVSFANANDGGATMIDAVDSEILSWSDTLIEVEIPYQAGTGTIAITHSDGSIHETTVPLTITYSHNNLDNSGTILSMALQDIDGNGGYTFEYHTDFNTSNAKSYFEEAFGLWNCESNINFSFGSTTTLDESVSDGINVVRFDNGSELSSGVLGSVTTRFTTYCGTTNRVRVDEMDITWNDDTNWYYGSGTPSATEYDFKTVALHELGHAHQLGHVIDSDVIMHYSLGPGEEKYALDQNDIDGALYTMGVFTESTGCGNTAMSEKLDCCDDITINSDPQDAEGGEGDTLEFTPSASDYDTVQWYVSTDGGSNFAVISDDSNYSGTNTETLTISNTPLSFDGYQYAAYFTNICSDTVATNAATLSVTAYTAIPDANFEAALEALGYDNISGDGQVPTENINTVTSLNVSYQSISDLTGIEDFIALETLEVYVNNLTSIDVSSISFLEHLNVSDNDLTTLDVSNNPDLRILYAGYNQFAAIDVSNNTELTKLYLINNSLTAIDVTNNVLLEDFQFHNNNLTTIDLSANEELDFLSGRDNNLTALDVSNNPLLEKIWCGNNAITSFDISNNPLVTVIQMGNNDLTYANLQNGNNTNVTSFDLSTNPNLGCILVDDVSYSNTNWTNIDAQTFFSDIDCNYTTIPDANFEARLDELGYDDISGDGKVPTSYINSITTLSVISKSISDLTGIEDFTALESLDCKLNSVTTLDLSNNTALTSVDCRDNSITSINVSNSSNLTSLKISGNNSLESLDISSNPQLQTLDCYYTDISTLDISNNTALRYLTAFGTNLSSLDTSNNPSLQKLECYNTNITSIDVTNNPLLATLHVGSLGLTELDLSNNTLLSELRLNGNLLTSLDLSSHTALEVLTVQDNDLSYLNLRNGNNTNITQFNITGNSNLTCIIVDDADYSTTNWTNIDATASFTETSYCRYTAILDANFEAALEALGYDDISGDGQVPTALIENVTSLQIGENTITDATGLEDFVSLTELDFYQIGLLSIDLSSNTLLEKVSLNNNPLASLDLSGLNSLTELEATNTDITSIDISANTLLVALDVSSNDSLSALNVRNGNNINFTTFNTTNTSALNCILVDDEVYSTTNWSGNIDSQTSFTETDYCAYTAIPDANFEAALDALGYDDISGDGRVPTALIEGVSSLNVSSNSIADLTGIEAFTSLTVLYCENNSLTSVDLSSLTNLIFVSLIQNELSSLDVSALTNLQILECDGNNLTTLDLSNNTNLDTLGATYNNLMSLNIQNGNNNRIGLEDFQVQNNDNLTCILVDDVSHSNSAWTDIDAQMFFSDTYCDYTTIPDSNFEAALETLGYDDISGDGQVPTANIETITYLSVSAKAISDLTGIEDFTSLTTLLANSNNLMEVNLSNNVLLETVSLSDNQLSEVDFSHNTEIDYLNVEGNQLEALDLSANVKLTNLDAYDNQITSLDFSNNPLIVDLDIYNNNLDFLNLKNENNTIITNIDIIGNSNLYCVLVDDATYSTNNWTDVEDILSFSDMYCRYTAIPDTNFEAALEALGYDDISGDGQVPTELIEVITSLDVRSLSITDLTGIEDFVALEQLYFSDNNISDVDISMLVNLQTLWGLANNLTTIDISNNLALSDIRMEENQLTTIDLSALTNLVILQVNDNQITSLDVSNSPSITRFRVYNNKLSTLDLSNNTVLQEVRVSGNELLTFNLQNGNNTNISTFGANGNFLSCILVDDATYSSTNWTDIDAHTSFNDTLCEILYTAIPDSNFEAALDALGYDDISSDGQVPTLYIEAVTDLDIGNMNIADLTGIQDFGALVDLDVSSNTLTTLDLSTNSLLETVNVSSNDLASLTLPTNGNLITFTCNFNTNLTSVDFSGNINLETIQCLGNGLTSVDVSGLNVLNSLALNSNSLSAIDVSSSSNLETLVLEDNAISTLDVSNNTNLTYLNAVSNNLNTLDISNNTALEYLLASNNNLSSIDVSSHPALVWLYTDNNQLTTIDIANNSLLEKLWVNENQLTNIDVSTNVALVEFVCNNNTITTLDVSANTALEWFLVNDNALESVNLQNGNNTNIFTYSSNNNPDLNCILVDDASYSTTNWTIVDAHTSFSDTFCNYTAIPDANFEAALDALGYDDITNDGQVPTALIEVVTTLNVQDAGITDLTGIEDFSALTTLTVSQNSLGTLALSNSNLTNLTASYCDLTSIDISQQINLEVLRAHTNNLTSVNTDTNIVLKQLDIYGNSITALDVSSNPLIEYLDIFQNEISTLDLSNNLNLIQLDCENNNLTELDLSLNTALTILDCKNNELTVLNVQNGNNSNITNFNATDNPDLACILVDDETYSSTNWTDIDSTASFSETICTTDYTFSIQVFLQGALLNPNTGEENLMRDDLRTAGYIPITSPYSDAATCDAAVFDTTGNDAIVDWVFVELRDPTDNTIVVTSQSFLLQRDGDVVDIDGVSNLTFALESDSYYITVNHRNHLGIMTTTEVRFSTNYLVNLNFTNTSSEITYGTNAQTDFGMPEGVIAMWAGDANADGTINLIGGANDTNEVRDTVLNDPINQVIQFYGFNVTGYNDADVNLTGGTQIIGSNNDANLVRDNILNHPINTFIQFYGFNITEQLPEEVSTKRIELDIALLKKVNILEAKNTK
ncbi:matrixin family metalloprotease [Aquimarina sp. MMG016]|uniref:matrixin family metalloprotease n=1 Tax=Aquimarina sp. MMG016 TaxID=2822690 RepID=UPI001B3A06E0|nr:matrixin family metalloprotease [Aquimarina sp. MMG016]MBQ4821720.1 matrixin family metalloprotease [Aquimarina sp. MMG016]